VSLSAGTRIGPFEIVSSLGAGGMGEVYRARDTALDRDVAIKVLPAELSKDDDRLARFMREARVLASLNHPNIAAIYALEPIPGGHALVLELVEGETLAAPSGVGRWRRHRRSSSLARLPMPSTPHTSGASFTAISSRRT
jgi:serine/threonine protein kinase